MADQNVVEPDYDAGVVTDLLKTHKVEIDKLRALVPALPAPLKEVYPHWDDLFLLRYILSHTTAAKAKKPLELTLAWRSDPKTQAMLEKCVTPPGESLPLWAESPITKTMQKFQVAGIHDCKMDGAPFVIIRPGLGYPSAMFDALSYEEMHLAHYAYREIAMRQCDKITRKTGRMVKQMLVFDMTGAKFGDMMDRRGQKVHQPISKACANYYPQLQSKFVMLNAPKWIAIVMGLMKRIMPKRNMDKVGLCPGRTSGGDISKCPYAGPRFRKSQVPVFLGGDLPNDAASLDPSITGILLDHALAKEGSSTSVTVAARSTHEIRVNVPCAGSSVEWTLSLAGYGIKLGAKLLHGSEPSKEKLAGGSDGGETIELTGASTVLREPAQEEKIKAAVGLVKGVWVCPSAGVLVVTLDNSYSRLRSKTVKYAFDLKPPATVMTAGSAAAADATNIKTTLPPVPPSVTAA